MVDGLFDNLTCKPKLIIKHTNNNDYITLETKTDTTLSPSTITLEISKNVLLPCAITPMEGSDLFDCIWGHKNGIWQPVFKEIPHGDNYIRFKDTNKPDNQKVFGDLALITLDNKNGSFSPILTWSKGMVVKKDLSVGGFVAANQGLIALGSGVEGQFDPPGIWLFQSETPALHGIDVLPSAPLSGVEGQLYINVNNQHLYQRYNAAWVDRGHVNEYNYKFDTVYIRKFSYKSDKELLPFEAPNRPIKNAALGNLACKDIRTAGDLTCQGTVICDGNIISHDSVCTAHLKTQGGTSIAIYNTLIPAPNATSRNLGSATYEFDNLYVKNLHVSNTSGSSTTDANGTKQISFPTGTFASGYTPKIVCTAYDTAGRSITAVVTAKSNTGFTVKTFLSGSSVHNHKVGDARISTSNPLTVSSSGSHNHTITNGSPQGVSTSNVNSHTHTYTSWVAATSTGSSGSHDHSMTKPTYVRELAMRKQDGSTHVVGVTMTQYNDALTEMWTHDNSSSTTNTSVQANFDWIAM